MYDIVCRCPMGFLAEVENKIQAKKYLPLSRMDSILFYSILLESDVTYAYMIPVSLLALGILIFIAGTPRYVISKPKEKMRFCSSSSSKEPLPSKALEEEPPTIPLFTVFRISLLIVPFCIAYSQMPTTFFVQGTVMRKAFHVVDAATMNALDALSVLVLGDT